MPVHTWTKALPEQRSWSQALVYHYHQLLVMKTRQLRLQKWGFFSLSSLFFVLLLTLHVHPWQTEARVGTLVLGSGFKHVLESVCLIGFLGCFSLGWSSRPQEEARREIAEHFYKNHVHPITKNSFF